MNTSTVLCMAGVALVLLAIGWLSERKRQVAVRAMVIRRGFTFGRDLPRSFTLQGTALEGASFWNIIEANRAGIRVIAFDCRVGSGKSRRELTAIAAQGPRDVFGAAKFSLDLTVVRSGDWTIMYRPGLMSVSELEAHFDAIGRYVGPTA
jgi:hypothetical protein